MKRVARGPTGIEFPRKRQISKAISHYISSYFGEDIIMLEYTQDGPEAQRIANVIPWYPFKGIPRFYDISGMTQDPEIFQLVVDIFVNRYKDLDIDCIAGLDARGFVLGAPIALALKKPFVMIRKKGKLPNCVTGEEYFKEYSEAHGGDEFCMSRTSIKEGSRVLVLDDLVATGGTLMAAADLLASQKAVLVEFACMVELKALGGYAKLQARHPGAKVWGLISEDILQLEGKEGTP
jgi:adenine phosphoribosyltransferase